MKCVALLFLLAGLSHSLTPALSNAQFESRAISGDPLRYMRNLVGSEAGPLWFGYEVVSNRKDGNSCCWNNDCAGCRLEGGPGRVESGNHAPVKLEGSPALFVLYRIQDHAIAKIHPVSENCPLDGGGLRFIWLTGMTPQASLAFLSEQVQLGSPKHEADSALVAIAMHAGDAADETLERFAAPSQPEWLRERALFWLSGSRGPRGFAAVKRVAEQDLSDTIREKAMFDFSISKEPAAIDELIHFAKRDPDSRVRGQALFWLARKAGQQASRAIRDSIENDPNTEVKKKAVFALQQLPKDEGVPLLIQVARTNHNPEVRKLAIFWLGQSGDPRAVAFFQEILAGKL